MLPTEGKLSLWCVLLAASPLTLILAESASGTCARVINITQNVWWLLPLYLTVLAVYLRLHYTGYLFQVGIRSVFLGGVFSLGGFLVCFAPTEWRFFGLYLCVMSFFHYSEFLAIALCNPKTLSVSSFLLNHSTQYNIAALASWLEFTLEVYLIPGIKNFPTVSYFGLLLCLFGEALRKCAMYTGSTNFAHIVQTKKEDDHDLVTHGIYAICRHPSYVGWFYWSIGTQVLLLNPLCVIAYTVVSWRFFKERIMHEEHTLLYFFGQDYVDYQKSVGTGLPWIKGFLIDD